MRPPECRHCGSKNVKLRTNVTTSGVRQFAWRCLDCDRWAEKPIRWLGHEYLSAQLKRLYGATLDQIPAVEDYSGEHPCVICGAPGEVHHWAPRAYKDEFGDDWWDWPTAPLCRKHHRLWHRVVTPELVYHDARRTETEKVR